MSAQSRSPRRYGGRRVGGYRYRLAAVLDEEEKEDARRDLRGGEKPEDESDEDETSYYLDERHIEDLVPMLPPSSSSAAHPFLTASTSGRRGRRRFLTCLFLAAVLGTLSFVYFLSFSSSSPPIVASALDSLLPDMAVSAEVKADRQRQMLKEEETKLVEHLRQTYHHETTPQEMEVERKQRLRLQEQVYEVERLRAQTPVLACLDEWIAEGRLCEGLRSAWSERSRDDDVKLARKHDILVTWVNGSDARHARARKMYASVEGRGTFDEWASRNANTELVGRSGSRRAYPISRPASNELEQQRLRLGDADNRYRDNCELVYALRSVRDNLQSLGNIHLVTPDFAAPVQEQPSWIASSKDTVEVGLPSSEPVEASLVDPFKALDMEPSGQLRWGQVPSWLDVASLSSSSSSAQGPGLILHHDSQVFHPLWAMSVGQNRSALLRSWLQQTLPTFNSMAVESMLNHQSVAGLSETYLAGNDDFFVTTPLAAADVSNPLMGPVLRFQADLLVNPAKPAPTPSPYRKLRPKPAIGQGEWPSLTGASTLLSDRFGRRSRAYVVHQYRTYVGPLQAEMQHMFRESVDRAAMARFRGAQGADQVSVQLMAYHFIVERHREALLWSALVAKIDVDGDDILNEAEWKALLGLLGWKESSGGNNKVAVRFPNRRSLASDGLPSVLRDAGLDQVRATRYQFTSADGYPFATLSRAVQDKPPQRSSGVQRTANEPYPDFVRDAENKPGVLNRFDDESVTACEISIATCLGSEAGPGASVQAIFKRFAFEEVQCGDCLITHLVSRSGPRGLGAFLPDKQLLFPASTAGNAAAADAAGASSATSTGPPKQPHLSTEARFATANFSLAHVGDSTRAQGRSRRRFVEELLLRYAYTIGDSRGRFVQLTGQRQAKKILDNITWERERASKTAAVLGGTDGGGKPSPSPVAFLCLNDDVSPLRNETIRDEIRAWGQAMFPHPLPFERPLQTL